MRTDDKATSQNENELPAYAPSWINRFADWVDRLPGPSWLVYPVIGLILFMIQTGILWGEGLHPVGTFLAVHGFLAGMIVLFPALIRE